MRLNDRRNLGKITYTFFSYFTIMIMLAALLSTGVQILIMLILVSFAVPPHIWHLFKKKVS